MIAEAKSMYNIDGLSFEQVLWPTTIKDYYIIKPFFLGQMNIAKGIAGHIIECQKFSKIFSLYCLHWVRNLGTAVYNIGQLLVVGGEGFVTIPVSHPMYNTYRKHSKGSKNIAA